MLDSLSKKQKIIFFIILSIMLIIIIYYIYSTLYSSEFKSYDDDLNLSINDLIDSTISEINYFSSNTIDIKNNTIIVYICGAVKNNTVVELKENSRICDAIDAAGGLNTNADLTNINLAYILEDGEKIYIPQKGENIEEDLDISSTNAPYSYNSYSSNSIKNKKININKATQSELETLPGIGPSIALKILEYRKSNGKFSSIEDIKNISGIGEAKFNTIKDFISIH